MSAKSKDVMLTNRIIVYWLNRDTIQKLKGLQEHHHADVPNVDPSQRQPPPPPRSRCHKL